MSNVGSSLSHEFGIGFGGWAVDGGDGEGVPHASVGAMSLVVDFTAATQSGLPEKGGTSWTSDSLRFRGGGGEKAMLKPAL